MAFFVPSLRVILIPLSILAGCVGLATSGQVVIAKGSVSGILGLEQARAGVVLAGTGGVSFVGS